MFDIIFKTILCIILIYCGFSVMYFFIFSLAAKIKSKTVSSGFQSPEKKIAILVPAYKEDFIIISTAKNLLSLNYPSSLFDVYILADSFKEATITELSKLPIHVLPVYFENSSKTKSLNEAFNRIDKYYDIALICDADNLLSKDFLNQVNTEFCNGVKALQGRRVAKNIDTDFALLDGCSEAINNHIFRKGANALGLSSAVIGSGMAFDYATLKNIISNLSVINGFDKPLQLKIVETGTKIKYLEDALIFDEKIDNPDAFKQQRKRWLLSQFIYLKQYFTKGFRQLFKGNISYFNLAVLNNIVSPRAFLIAGLPLFCVISFFVQPSIIFTLFLLITLLYFTALFIALPSQLLNKKLLIAVLQLPKAIVLMVFSLFKLKKAKNVFIHTVHTKNEISNPMFNVNDK